MQILIPIALGGALGAVTRYGASLGVHALAGYGFPYGTLLVNVVGSFLIGIAYIVVVEANAGFGHYRAPLMIGLLGAFTTFSAFSLETIHLLEAGAGLKATLNVFLNVGLCLVACWVGIALARAHF